MAGAAVGRFDRAITVGSAPMRACMMVQSFPWRLRKAKLLPSALTAGAAPG
jgi:hypothetical protein